MLKNTNTYLLIDVGGTNIKYSLIDASQEITTVHEVATNLTQTFSQIEQIIAQFYHPNLAGVAISSMGVIDSCQKVVARTNQLVSNYQHCDFKQLEQKYSIPIHIINDANAAALAEFEPTQANNIVTITFGTGVGVGIILNKELFVGANFLGGELGYLKYHNQFIDQYFSFSGFNQKIKHKYNFTSKDQKQFCQAYQTNHNFQAELDQYLQEIGQFLAQIAIILNLDFIFLGGGLSYLDPQFLAIIQTQFDLELKTTPFQTQVKIAQHQNHAGLYGA